MYKWFLIFLMLPVAAFGQYVTPGGGGGTSDSMGVDTDGDGTVDAYLYSTTAGAFHLKKGTNITLTVDTDTVTIAGPASSGTADSMGVDTDGDGTIDDYLYSTVAGAFHIKKGSNITLTVDTDTLTIAGPASSGTADSLGIDTDGNGTIDNYLYSTAGAIAMIRESTGIILTVDTDTLYVATTLGVDIESSEIVDQTIVRADIDSTIGITIGSPSFIINSVEADSKITTINFVQGEIGDTATVLRANMGDSARVAAGDSLAIALRLAGGTMAGNIVMDNYDITGADVLSADSIIIGEDTLYDQHIIAYLTRLRVRNASAATLTAGTPVYISGITGNRPNVDSARADNATLMPAIGLIEHDISSSADGFVVISGEFGPYNTLAWSVEDPLYIDATGGITSTKPTGTNLIQKIGIVTRDNVSVGTIQLVGAGRTNDLPNIASANFWIGNASGVPTAVTMSGDATMDNAGAVTVADSAITVGKIDHSDAETNWLNAVYGTIAGETWSGVHDYGGATSLEIPNGDTPTTDAEGEIAWDSDDDAIEVYSGDEGESVLIPIYKHITAAIVLPDSVQTYVPNLIIFHVNSLVYPAGIEIDLVSIQLEADAAYSMVIEEWSGADPPVLENIISTVTTGGTDTYAEEAPDNDGVLDAGDRIVLNIPTTDVDVVTVAIYFHIYDN